MLGLVCLAAIVALLEWERFRLAGLRKKIALRIGVTGTRGKSTVTRLIAAALRESGRRVMAKTTGSRPVLIYPDGREQEITRRGLPTILEGKKLLREAVRSGADVLVAELMSIRPDCLAAETGGILRPQHVVITNARLDHMDEMGGTRAEVARSLAAAVVPDSRVYILDGEMREEFATAAAGKGARLVSVASTKLRRGENIGPGIRKIRDHGEPGDTGFSKVPATDASAPGTPLVNDFEENIRLAAAVAAAAGVDEETAFRGMAKRRADFGGLKVWRSGLSHPSRTWYLVSAFAANEPESTRRVLEVVRSLVPFEGKAIMGLLNFRPDRGERTLQWLKAIEKGFFQGFDRLLFIGAHIHSLKVRRICRASRFRASVIKARSPETIMMSVLSMTAGDSVLIGMGNIGGLGEKMVNHWESTGTLLHA